MTKFEEEIISNMKRNINVSEDKSNAIAKLAHAVDCLYSAMTIFEEKGLSKQAQACENILVKIAKKEKLTSKKMIKNLLDHGTEFNLSHSHKKMEDILSAKDNDFIPDIDLDSLDPEIASLISDDGVHVNKSMLDLDINAADLEVGDFDTESFEDE